MTQEEKDLLKQDLCSRLPYGVKVLCLRDFNHDWYNLEMVDIGDNEVYVTTYEPYANRFVKIEEVRPYLFPLSSMTEEQKNDCPIDETNLNIIKSNIGYGIIEIPWQLSYLFIDWCNKNHFDYRGLIPKWIANDATGLNIY